MMNGISEWFILAKMKVVGLNFVFGMIIVFGFFVLTETRR
jgi:hypothetical protein